MHHEECLIDNSLGQWPNSQKLRDELAVPLTLSIAPLDPCNTLASFSGASNLNPYRCHSCKAFINNLCVISISEGEEDSSAQKNYDCSICGCSNRLPTNFNPLSPQLTNQAYVCETRNLNNKMGTNEKKTYAFVFDITPYGVQGHQTSVFMHYWVEVLRNFIKQLREQPEPAHCQVLIMAFDCNMHEYYVDSNGQVSKVINTHLEETSTTKKQHFFTNWDHLQEIISQEFSHVNGQSSAKSEGFLAALEAVMAKTRGCMGSIFIVSGLRSPPGTFFSGIDGELEIMKGEYEMNRSKCLSPGIRKMLESTRMSLNFFIFTNSHVNLLPLYILSKESNGVLRRYHNTQHQLLFYYQFQHAVCAETRSAGTDVVVRVRLSSGITIASISGQYRYYKGTKDQLELITCPLTRRYLFQFMIQGKIQRSSANIQFSILWTDSENKRHFKVITHSSRITDSCSDVLDSVNYTNFNYSYLQGVVHHLDTSKSRNLQGRIENRCKVHIQAVRKHARDSTTESLKATTPYILFTYYLMRHFIMNMKWSHDVHYDMSVELRSRIATGDENSILSIWPAVYQINHSGFSIIEMREKQVSKTEIALFIDQGDYCHLYIADRRLRDSVFARKNPTNQYADIMLESGSEELIKVGQLLKTIQQQKLIGYMDIIMMMTLEGVSLLDKQGNKSYEHFIQTLTADTNK